MIILIHGNDEIRSRDKYNALIDSLLAKSPEASLFKLSSENFKVENLEELTKGQGLFYKKFIVGCDNLLDSNKDNNLIVELVKSRLKSVSESENVFIFLENRIEEKDLLELKKLATKEQELRRYSTKDTKMKMAYIIK